jgi:hypothetical protein
MTMPKTLLGIGAALSLLLVPLSAFAREFITVLEGRQDVSPT